MKPGGADLRPQIVSGRFTLILLDALFRVIESVMAKKGDKIEV